LVILIKENYMKKEERMSDIFEKIAELMKTDASFEEQEDAFLNYLVNIDREDIYSIIMEMITVIIAMDTPEEMIYNPEKFMDKDISKEEEKDECHLRIVH
tara:strand:- start:2196 stop:2495 length:300 start_codon:yes stop_codon:yes gene_type:complete